MWYKPNEKVPNQRDLCVIQRVDKYGRPHYREMIYAGEGIFLDKAEYMNGENLNTIDYWCLAPGDEDET